MVKRTFSLCPAILCVLLVAGCREQKENVESFDNVVVLSQADTLLTFDAPDRIRDIAVTGDSLIVLGARMPLVKIFEKGNGTLRTSAGMIGRADNEFVMPPTKVNVRNGSLEMMDVAKRTLHTISLTDSLTDFSHTTFALPVSADFRPMHAVSVGQRIVCTGSFSNSRFGTVDKSDSSRAEAEYDYPFDCEPVEGIYRGLTFQSGVRVQPNGNRFVIHTLVSDDFEIYELRDTMVERIYVSPCNHVPKLKPKGSQYSIDGDLSMMCITRVSVSDDGIYLGWSDDSYSESVKNDLATDCILRYDWQGRKVCKYVLSGKVTVFCCDGTAIYGVVDDEARTLVVAYQIRG